MAPKTTARRKRARFGLAADKGSEVHVEGTFNGWDPRATRLSETNADGMFTRVMLLPKGRHQYKFVFNGTWCVDPQCSDCVANGHGSLNSVLQVG